MPTLRNAVQKASTVYLPHLQGEDEMRRPTKLMLKLAHVVKQESQARMRVRVKSAIRQHNHEAIATNWRVQAEAKL